jgi:hypothetical protein
MRFTEEAELGQSEPAAPELASPRRRLFTATDQSLYVRLMLANYSGCCFAITESPELGFAQLRFLPTGTELVRRGQKHEGRSAARDFRL